MAVARVKDRAADWTYPYVPHDRQALAHRSWAHERLYGGAAGGGKTDWLLGEVLRPVLQFGVNGLILRRTMGELAQADGIINRLEERIPESVGKYNRSSHVWTFFNGAKVFLGYLAGDGHVQRYMGAQYGVIAFDELTQFTEWQYRRMAHPLRVRREVEERGFTPYRISATNPGGVGHGWVKDRFVDPAPPGVVWQPRASLEENRPGSRCFIPSTVLDNPYIGEAYIENLQGLPEDDRRALLLGDWDVYQGQRFRDFRRSIHVISPESVPLPLGALPRAIGYDYGYTAPACALWGAKIADNHVVVYREWYQAGLTDEQQAHAIRALEGPGERDHGRPLPMHVDPSIFTPGPSTPPKVAARSKSLGLPPPGSIASVLASTGLDVHRADNDRIKGVQTVANALRVRGDGKPRLWIYDTCTNLIRTLPALPRDPVKVEDVDTRAEDHAYDALRYLLIGMGISAGVAPAPPPRATTGSGVPATLTAGLARQEF